MSTLMMPSAAWLLKSRQLAEVSRSLTYAMGADEVMQFTVSRAASLLDTEKAVLLTNDVDGVLTVRASIGIAIDLAERFEAPLVDLPGPRLESVFGVAEHSFLGVPLVVSGQISGILAVARAESTLSQEEQEFLLSALADQAAVAIEQVQLGEKAHFRERLIGIVSHDLRSPVCAISMVAQSLLRKRPDDAYVAAAAQRIERSAQRATRMIRDLLDYTQFHLGGGVQLQCATVVLDDVLARCVDEITQVSPARKIELTKQGNACGHWDCDRLEQAIGNVLMNALVYSPKDSVVRVKTWQSNAWVGLSVHNDGAPIAPGLLGQIFEPMQRGDAVSNSTRSVGLGLYIVKKIVDAHNGSVRVASSIGKGTTVTVELPRLRDVD